MGRKTRRIKNLEADKARLSRYWSECQSLVRNLETDNERLRDLVTHWQKRFDEQQEKNEQLEKEVDSLKAWVAGLEEDKKDKEDKERYEEPKTSIEEAARAFNSWRD